MSEQSAIESATKRLTLALDALDAAVESRRDADRAEAQLADQLHALGSARSRRAAERDTQAARSRRREAAHPQIARRLDAAMDNIRSVLDGQDR